MFRNLSFRKIILSTTLCWLVLCLIFGTFESASDGWDKVGLPVVFYMHSSGKLDHPVTMGFFWKEFLIDILIVFIVALILNKLSNKNNH
jgi:hypothetical protein